MIEKLRNGFHQFYLIFNNFVIVLSIPIIFALSLASGYTTFHGMNIYVPSQWIAAIITFAVQAVIIIASIELGKTHIRANVMRFIGLVISLFIGLTVSMFFSYFTFFENSEASTTKEKKLRQLNTAINGYIDKAWESKTEIILKKEARIKAARQEVDDAFWGRGKDIPGKMRKPGKGRLYRYYKDKLDKEEAGLETLKTEFLSIQNKEKELRKSMADLSMIEVVTPSEYAVSTQAVYERVRQQFASLAGMFEHIFSDNGLQPVKLPELMPHDMYVKMTPTLDDISENPLSALPLSLAVVIDILTFVLSYRLQIVPMGNLFEEQKLFVYQYLKEFSKWQINTNDQLEFEIEKTDAEENSGYNDGSRKFAAATLLNLGFIRRVKKHSAEFTSFFYPIVMEQIIRERENVTEKEANLLYPSSEENMKTEKDVSGEDMKQSRKNEWQFGDPDLQIAYRSFLFSKKYIELPSKIRFNDKIISLPVEEIEISGTHSLFSSLIIMEFQLNILFQATLDYVRNTFKSSFVSDINKNIRDKYKDLLRQIAIDTLKRLEDDIKASKDGIEALLNDSENVRKNIECDVNTYLTDKGINASTTCVTDISFKKFSEGEEGLHKRLLHRDIYDYIETLNKDLRKSQEENEKKIEFEEKRKERDQKLETIKHEVEVLERESKHNEKRRTIQLSEEEAKYEFEKKIKQLETDHKIFMRNEARREESERQRMELKSRPELINSEESNKFLDNKIEILTKGKQKAGMKNEIQKGASPIEYKLEKKKKVS